MAPRAIAVHGGAGGSAPRDARPHRAALAEALDAAAAALDGGGAAVDAARAAVVCLEDCPHFNAGIGSVLHRDGGVEMDAGMMDGRTREAGAVAGVTRVRHPIELAHAVMVRSPHVVIAGPAADELAAEWGLELALNEAFVTERQRERWRTRHPDAGDGPMGTVGAVVRDDEGHLAAATSTGGVRDQAPGRVGDSPLPGAGVYAEDGVCAVSATGGGEEIVRAVLAHEVAALVRHCGFTISQATEVALRDRLEPLGGQGGLIAVSPAGEVAMPFLTDVMFRGCWVGDGPARTAVGREAPQ